MNIAIVQAPLIWEDVTGNLMAFDARLLKIDKADVIVLPEMFSSGFSMEGKEKIASQYDNVCQRMQVWAENKQALVIGSTVFCVGRHFYNRLLAVFPSGETLTYDKRHRFTMGGENKHFVAGQQQLVFDYKGARFAPFICYDLRFPVWSRNVSGYDIAVYVANWPQARRSVWQTLLKARALYELVKAPVLADDSGLCVDALSGRPGIHTARYGCEDGRKLTSQEQYTLLLKEMEGVQDRSARFVSACVLMLSPSRIHIIQESVEGRIATAPAGLHGFGYDPIFLVGGGGRSMAQLSDEEKDEVSHRGRAMRRIGLLLKEEE